MRYSLTSKTSLRLFAVLAFSSAIALSRLLPSLSWLSDILLTSAIGLAVFADGWIGGIVILAVAPLTVVTARGQAFGEWITGAVVVVVMLFARRRIAAFRSSESR